MVPMKTKNKPNAKESATSVMVLGEAISRLLPAPGASKWNERESHGFPGKLHQGGWASGGATNMATRWFQICSASAASVVETCGFIRFFYRKRMTSATTHCLSMVHSLRFLRIYAYLRLNYLQLFSIVLYLYTMFLRALVLTCTCI